MMRSNVTISDRSHKKLRKYTLYYGKTPVKEVQGVPYPVARAKELELNGSPNYKNEKFSIRPYRP